MKRNFVIALAIAIAISVAVVVNHPTASKMPASVPISLAQRPTPSRIAPNLPTNSDAPVVTTGTAQPAPAQKYWYGPDRDEVGAGIEAELKRQREHPQTPSGSDLKPLNVK